MNMKYAKLVDNNLKYAPDYLIVNGILITNPNGDVYLSNGWKEFIKTSPEQKDGYYAVQDGYEETETKISTKWKYVENPTVYRKFSKLKIYGAISSLNKWNEIQTWLENKNINGINGWLSFQLAQEISEDHPLFKPLANEAKEILNLDDLQFETLLNNCILEY